MTNATHDRMHELLCAYVLGEATADERAEVERALASSPELALEKQRIEATIGLVQSAITEDETLSAARREEVLRAAVPPRALPRAWWREGWVRAAAGILFVSFALGGWSIYEQNRRARECDVARVDGASDRRAGFGRDRDEETFTGGFVDAGKVANVENERAKPASGTAELADATADATADHDAHHGVRETDKSAAAVDLAGAPAEPAPASTPGATGNAPSEAITSGRMLRLKNDADDGRASKADETTLEYRGLDPRVPGGGGGGVGVVAPATSSRSDSNAVLQQKLAVNGGLDAGGQDLAAAGALRPSGAPQDPGNATNYFLGATPTGPSTGGPAGTTAPAPGVFGGRSGGAPAATKKNEETWAYKSRAGAAPAPTAGLAAGEKGQAGGAPGAPSAEDRLHLGAEVRRVAEAQKPQESFAKLPARGESKKDVTTPQSASQLDLSRFARADDEKVKTEAKERAPGDAGAIPKSLEENLVLFEESETIDSLDGGIDLRGFDVPQYRKFSTADNSGAPFGARAGGGGLAAVDGKLVELSDEDRFILTQLGLQPGQALPPITPELRVKYRDAYVDHWCQRIRRHCERRPDETPRDMFFRFWGDNPFELSALDPLSTFSADVDTASYALARRYLREGHLPEKAQIRTEEFVNAFKADVPPPTQGTFAIDTTLAPSRYGLAAPGEPATSARDLLRVTIRGKDVPKAERKPLALTFVVDCSGSMKEQNRIEMVKHAMRLLVSQLDARDSIAIVKFSTDASMVLPMTSAKNKDVIESAIFPLAADGSTNSEAGLKMGYAAAITGLNVEATNRVVFLSDGVANVGVTDPNVISEGVKQLREKGIYLNTVGVGMNNHNDTLLEQLADKGDGVCNYVDGPDEAKKVFVDQFMGTVETIARDVKLQVEFDPAQVFRYRLLGYENRAIADADFRNDKVDAGEVGAGHQVTALYEIEYATPSKASEKPLATVRVRYKAPRNPNAPTANEEATELSKPVTLAQRTSWEGAGPGYRKLAIVAQFAEFLRRSIHARNDSFDQLIADAKKLESELHDAEFTELVTLLDQSKALILSTRPQQDELALAIDQIRENHVLRAQLERLAAERDQQLLAELEKQNRDMEARLKELLRHRLEQPR